MRSQEAKGKPFEPTTNPVIDLLLAPEKAISLRTFNKDEQSRDQDGIVVGLDALTRLRDGFGAGRYSSLSIDADTAKKNLSAERSQQFDERILQAMAATSDRKFERAPKKPTSKEIDENQR